MMGVRAEYTHPGPQEFDFSSSPVLPMYCVGVCGNVQNVASGIRTISAPVGNARGWIHPRRG